MKRVLGIGVSFIVFFLLLMPYQFSGQEKIKIDWTHSSSSRFRYRGDAFPQNKKTVQWLVKRKKKDTSAEILVESQKVGKIEKKIFLQKGGR